MSRISGPELRPDWVGTGLYGRVAGSGWRGRLPAGRWSVRTCRKAGDRWRELCASHATTRLPFGGGGAFSVFIESQRCLFGAAGTGGGRFGAARFSSSPSRPLRFRLAHPVGSVWQCQGQRAWIGVVLDRLGLVDGGIASGAGGAFGHAEKPRFFGAGRFEARPVRPLAFGHAEGTMERFRRQSKANRVCLGQRELSAARLVPFSLSGSPVGGDWRRRGASDLFGGRPIVRSGMPGGRSSMAGCVSCHR